MTTGKNGKGCALGHRKYEKPCRAKLELSGQKGFESRKSVNLHGIAIGPQFNIP
jgi:hypothetical protein